MIKHTASAKLLTILILYILLFLMLLVRDNHASTTCYNMADIVIAVDTTSSLTGTDFETLKTQLKIIVAGFTITEPQTRFGLISISDQANTVSSLDSFNSMTLNAAIDKLTFSRGDAKLSEGIRVAKESVLRNVKTSSAKRSQMLILVKDRRSENAYKSAELRRIESEAAEIMLLGAKISAVGIGGLWIQQELESLFGTNYTLFNNEKFTDWVKSLNNPVCVSCPRNGTVVKKDGLCYNKTKYTFLYNIALTTDSRGDSVCRIGITKNVYACNPGYSDHANEPCNKRSRTIGPCKKGKQKIVNHWRSFDPKLQSCVTTDVKRIVKCGFHGCIDEVADIMFILDKSGSMKENYNKIIQAVKNMVKALKIGPDNVRVGVITFNNRVIPEIAIHSTHNKTDLLWKIGKIPKNPSQSTATDLALKKTREIFSTNGRQGVQKYAFIFTDGASDNPDSTFMETKNIKEAGIILFAVGIGSINRNELLTMTAPESSSNLFIFEDFDSMIAWSRPFSASLCIHLAAPIPKLCDDSVFVQSISDCVSDKQLVTRSQYKYNEAKKCIKSFQMTEFSNCRSTCLDPINGNEYFEGESWESFCNTFKCTGGVANRISDKCRAADGTCWSDGTGPFQCVNDLGEQVNNCSCIPRATIVIDTKWISHSN